MRPFTVLIGLLMGSAASITFGLGAVLTVFCVLAGKHPDLARELPKLVLSLLAFADWTAASAGSFPVRLSAVRGAAGRMRRPSPA